MQRTIFKLNVEATTASDTTIYLFIYRYVKIHCIHNSTCTTCTTSVLVIMLRQVTMFRYSRISFHLFRKYINSFFDFIIDWKMIPNHFISTFFLRFIYCYTCSYELIIQKCQIATGLKLIFSMTMSSISLKLSSVSDFSQFVIQLSIHRRS